MGDKELANAVIIRAIRDLEESKCKDEYALLFLLGHTPLSKFWFAIAGLKFMNPKEVGKSIRIWREHEILDRRKKGIRRCEDFYCGIDFEGYGES